MPRINTKRSLFLLCGLLLIGILSPVSKAAADVPCAGDRHSWSFQIDSDGNYLTDSNSNRLSTNGSVCVQNNVILYCEYCSGMLDIPEGIIGISPGALRYSGSAPFTGQISGIDIPNSMSQITRDMLGDPWNPTASQALTHIRFKPGTNPLTIDNNAFSSTLNLTSIRIPARTISIGSGALSHMSTVTFETGTSPLEIGNGAFQNNTFLTRIKIPGRTVSIGSGTFSGNTALRLVDFETSTASLSIGIGAFSGDTNLTTVTFPDRLDSLGENIFQGSGVSTITFLGSAPTVETTTSSGTLSDNFPVAYVDTAVANSFVPANPYWYGLSISLGRGPMGPRPTIDLISSGDIVRGSVGAPLQSYQLSIFADSSATYSVISGSLPTGVSVSSQGLISGTPTAAGSFNPVIQISDQYGTDSVLVPIVIFQNLIPIEIIDRVQDPKGFITTGGLTYFSGRDESNRDRLWVSDGTNAGTRIVGSTVQSIYDGAYSITPVPGGVVFQGYDMLNSEAPALYFSDGSSSNPRKITTEYAPNDGYTGLTYFQNRLYYIDSDGQLRCISMSGATIPISVGSDVQGMTPVGSRLYYIASDYNLKFIDSSTNLSIPVTVDLDSNEPLPKFAYTFNLTSFKGGILFRAWDPTNGFAIWRLPADSLTPINLTAGYTLDELMDAYGSSLARNYDGQSPFPTHKGVAYFLNGGDLWSTDGITVSQVANIGNNGGNFLGIWKGDKFFFTSDLQDGRGVELQLFNSVTNAIVPVTDIKAGSESPGISEYGSNGTTLFFSGYTSDSWDYFLQFGTSELDNDQENSNQQNNNQQNNNQQQNQNSPVGASVPEPVQKSHILSGLPEVTESETVRVIVIRGTFLERIISVYVNGAAISSERWHQSSNALSIHVPRDSASAYLIQIYNGSVPVLPEQVVIIPLISPRESIAKPVDVAPTPTSSGVSTPSKPAPQAPVNTKTKSKQITIKCVKGKTVKYVKDRKPKCPSGYVKR